MEKDEKGYYTVKLGAVGVSNRTGDVYPEGVLRRAIETLKRRQAGPLHGEFSQQSIMGDVNRGEDISDRLGKIKYENISHLIDVESLRIEDGYVTGRLKPAGPNGPKLEELFAQEQAHFALRGYCNFKEPVDGVREVENLQFITFDLVNKPL